MTRHTGLDGKREAIDSDVKTLSKTSFERRIQFCIIRGTSCVEVCEFWGKGFGIIASYPRSEQSYSKEG